MLFDWITLVAQLVNFIVLVWLLKRFLYKPILDAIDERESLIARQLLAAEAIKADANKELENYHKKNSEINQQHHKLLTNAISEVNAEKKKLLEQTRLEVESLRMRLQESLRSEQQNLGTSIIRLTRNEVFAIVRKTLSDLASVNLEDQMTTVFIQRLNALTEKEIESFYSALKSSPGDFYVQSMFDLTLAQQSAIQNALKNNFKVPANIIFTSGDQSVSGIEFISDGFKVSWTIEDYLTSMETHLAELLNQNVEMNSEEIIS